MRGPRTLIVGGGPAGATAAETLARQGRNVVLVERSGPSPFRDKPCGGGLGPVTVKLFPYTKTRGIHTTKRILMSLGEDKISVAVPIVMVDRRKFDFYLLERSIRAGAKVVFGKTVKAIDYDRKKAILYNNMTMQFSSLIGAGGVRCPVAKKGLTPKTVPLLVGKADGGVLNTSETAEIVFFEGFKGYAWIFPKKNFLDVGIGGDAPVKELQERLEAFLKERSLTIYDKTGWTIPFDAPDPDSLEMLVDGDTVLCGDGAGFANPATGEGIRYAMQSGKEAAEVLLKKRNAKTYPSFVNELVKLHQHREQFFNRGLKISFSEMTKSPELAQEMVGFFFEDRPAPSWAPLSDAEKLKALKALDAKLGD